MNNIIKVNNQTIVKILGAIEKDKDRYSELWEIIGDKKVNLKNPEEKSIDKTQTKFIGNLDFINLKNVESSKLLAEITERINSGEIKLNVFNCCYLMQCFEFIRKNIEEANIKDSKKEDNAFSLIQTNHLNLFIAIMLDLLKKDNLLCPAHSKLVEDVEQNIKKIKENTKKDVKKAKNKTKIES